MNTIPQPATRARGAATARRSGGRAFTLVEILIVVVILGILAGIVIPQFTSASEDSRENSLRMSLHRIRQQLEIYRAQHNDTYPDNDPAIFVRQMTEYTDVEGNPDPVSGPFGPYLRELPVSPFTGTSDVSDTPLDGSAWYYQDGIFLANDHPTRATY